MIITMRTIAEASGVSVSSVSRVLNGQGGVSPAKRNAILAITEELGYCPNAVARGLVKKNTGNIGLIIPDITNPFFPEIAIGVEKEARNRGYNLILCNSRRKPQDELKCMEALIQNRVDGIIIEPCSLRYLEALKERSLPIVSINGSFEVMHETAIGIDNVRVGEMATEFLIQRGYRHIGFAGGNVTSKQNSLRYKGYVHTMKAMGRPIRKEHVIHGSFDVDSGYDMAKQMLCGDSPTDAIVAANDLIALGVISYAAHRGIGIPDDLGLIGCDDIYIAKLPQIELTTVAIPKEELGRNAFEMLRSQIEDGNPQGEQQILAPQLMIRRTTR